MWQVSSQTRMSPQEEEKRFQEETAPKEWLRLGQMNEDGVGVLNKEQCL